MADDARISTALPNHPKTIRLERRLGAEGFSSLIKLFLWTSDNRPDGDLAGMDVEAIEIAARWNGAEGRFVEVLCEVGFLDCDDHNYRIHDWADHNPWAATRTKRRQASQKANATRWNRRNGTSLTSSDSESAITPIGLRLSKSGIASSPLLSSPHLTTVKTPPQSEPHSESDKTEPYAVPLAPQPEKPDAFDREDGFWQVHKAYPRREKGHAAQEAYCRAIEEICQERRVEPQEAQAWLLARIALYCQLVHGKFQVGMTKFLSSGFYDQDESAWRDADSQASARASPMLSARERRERAEKQAQAEIERIRGPAKCAT